jgi:23S rRNA (guanosine2251-2'-O)-methyltransferase
VQLVFGTNPVLEQLRAAPDTIEAICAVPEVGATERVLDEARARGVRIEPIDRATLDRLVGGGHHQGVVARTRSFAYAALADALEADGLLVALDGINDPQNLGAIIRSAEVLGAKAVIIPRDRSATITPAVVRAASGATAHLPIVQVVNLVRTLAEVKERGYWIVALDASGTLEFQELPRFERGVLVIGSEARGARPLVLKACDFVVRIPMKGKVGSLNAAAAAAVGIYTLVRQLGSVPHPREC